MSDVETNQEHDEVLLDETQVTPSYSAANIQPTPIKKPELSGDSITLELFRIVHEMDSKLEARKHTTEDLLHKLNSIESNVGRLQDTLNRHIEETSKKGLFNIFRRHK